MSEIDEKGVDGKLPQPLTDEQIVTEKVVPRRSFLAATGAALMGGAAAFVLGRTVSAQPRNQDPDKPKPEDPDKPRPNDPDKPRPNDPDKPRPEDPDKPRPQDPDKPQPQDPNKPRPEDPDKPKPKDPDKRPDAAKYR